MKIPFAWILARATNNDLLLASAWNGESDEPNEISNWKNKDVATIAGVGSQYQSDKKIGVIEKCIELVFAKETPRCPVEKTTILARSKHPELAILNLNFAINQALLVSPPKNHVNFIHVQKPGVWIPSVLEELDFCVSFAKNLAMTSSASVFG
jgi:hypothetical protein